MRGISAVGKGKQVRVLISVFAEIYGAHLPLCTANSTNRRVLVTHADGSQTVEEVSRCTPNNCMKFNFVFNTVLNFDLFRDIFRGSFYSE